MDMHLLFLIFLLLVTYVNHSFGALKVVAEKGKEFDFLLIDRDITGVDVHTFLRLSRNLEIPSIAMSEQEDDAFELEAFKNGALCIIKRPLTVDALKIIHQHFIKERIYKRATILEQISSGGKRKFESSEGLNGDGSQYVEVKLNKKTYLEWTPGLHLKFLTAVHHLGKEKCCPKQILDLMGIPGLTRMQVASHLQKCRRDWKSTAKQATPSPLKNHTLTSNLLPQGVYERRYGRMASLQKDQEESDTHLGMNLSINGSSSLMSISNQKSARPQIPYTPIFFKSGLGSNQDEGCSSRINKKTTNYFGQEISGVSEVGESSKHHQYISIESEDSDDEFPDFLRDLDGNGPKDM